MDINISKKDIEMLRERFGIKIIDGNVALCTAEQLATNIASLDVTLSDEVLHNIETAHDADRYPCP